MRLRPLCLLALTAAAALTGAAPAQFGEAAGFGEMMSPYFLRRDLQIFQEGLELDEGQAVIVESLFWDYEDDHESGKVRMLERLSEMRENIDQLDRDRILQMVFQPFEQRSQEWDQMREQFLSNVRAILSSDQEQRWPDFRRDLRRRKELPKGRFSGENLNLFEIVREMELDPRTRRMIDEPLNTYGITLDEALVRRERLLHDSRLAIMHSIRDENPGQALDIYEQQITARMAIRRVNDDYTEVIAAGLPEDLAATFREKALAKAYPRVYRPTAAHRLFTEALKLPDLTTESRQAVMDLERSFLGEVAGLNARLVVLLRDYEPEENRYRAQSFATRAGGIKPEKPKDPTRAVFKERDQLGRRYIELLRDLLTPEQFDSLAGSQRFNRRGGARDPLEQKRQFMERQGNKFGVSDE
ncbi:MAG: hypothetical protein HKO59_00205 [Phycisphaerales bacterium]|nr:hypothetical protein [Phycisphaerae bacterium]NNF44514.1 hypothetical protein [Phycisphaerales bacterium]NNM24403.1 hypothetical protein [Phycisphaerales bacterium]